MQDFLLGTAKFIAGAINFALNLSVSFARMQRLVRLFRTGRVDDPAEETHAIASKVKLRTPEAERALEEAKERQRTLHAEAQ